jgi:AraC-like DNA-binding protein
MWVQQSLIASEQMQSTDARRMQPMYDSALINPQLQAATGPDQAIERLFYPSPDGYIFATNRLVQRLQLPFYGMVVLSIDGKPIRVSIDGQECEHRAMALWARDVRFLESCARFVVVAANPFNPLFRAFTKIPSPNVTPLDLARFAQFDALAHSALESRHFTHEEALALHRGVLETCREFLPAVPPLDARSKTLMEMLCDRPRSSLAELAKSLNLSYHRTSHLFAETVGISVRTYQLWQKLYRAGGPRLRGASLTEAAHAAGFVDSAHYSNAFQTAYGRSPTDMFKTRRVIVFYRDAFTEAAIGETIRLRGAAMENVRT